MPRVEPNARDIHTDQITDIFKDQGSSSQRVGSFLSFFLSFSLKAPWATRYTVSLRYWLILLPSTIPYLGFAASSRPGSTKYRLSTIRGTNVKNEQDKRRLAEVYLYLCTLNPTPV